MGGRFTRLPERLRESAALISTGEPLDWGNALALSSTLEDAALKIEALEREAQSEVEAIERRLCRL